MIGLDNIKRKANEKGITILEALVSTAIIGIGFVAVFQMVQYSIRSIDVSGERTKMNYLVSMIAEDIISDRDSVDASKKPVVSISGGGDNIAVNDGLEGVLKGKLDAYDVATSFVNDMNTFVDAFFELI